MHRKLRRRTRVKALAASVVALAAFNVMVWGAVLLVPAPSQVVRDDGAAPVHRKSTALPPRPVESTTEAQKNVGLPVRISIPSIAVDAAIEKVVLAADGSMGVPKNPFDTAWYGLGARPGEAGSAAIAGHVDWEKGPAVFANLHKVKQGDRIEVRDDNGGVILFVVRGSRRLHADADATDVFTSRDGKAHLNLITCAGSWDKQAKQYSERLVLFADRVTE